MVPNRIDAELVAAARTEVFAALQTIRDRLAFLLDLTPEDRRTIPKFNDDQGFVRRALEVAEQNPDILRRSFSTEAMRRDVELSDALDPIRLALNQLAELVDDTHMAARSDAFIAALAVLDAVKDAGGPGLDATREELQRRFRRPKGEPPAPEA